MEGLGKKLKDARLARGLTLDDAYRMTKIRPNRLEAIENEDFSLFDSLTYSKAAVLIYGKFQVVSRRTWSHSRLRRALRWTATPTYKTRRTRSPPGR
jgi:cytoskeletal protein RodZ